MFCSLLCILRRANLVFVSLVDKRDTVTGFLEDHQDWRNLPRNSCQFWFNPPLTVPVSFAREVRSTSQTFKRSLSFCKPRPLKTFNHRLYNSWERKTGFMLHSQQEAKIDCRSINVESVTSLSFHSSRNQAIFWSGNSPPTQTKMPL